MTLWDMNFLFNIFTWLILFELSDYQYNGISANRFFALCHREYQSVCFGIIFPKTMQIQGLFFWLCRCGSHNCLSGFHQKLYNPFLCETENKTTADSVVLYIDTNRYKALFIPARSGAHWYRLSEADWCVLFRCNRGWLSRDGRWRSYRHLCGEGSLVRCQNYNHHRR